MAVAAIGSVGATTAPSTNASPSRGDHRWATTTAAGPWSHEHESDGQKADRRVGAQIRSG
jgi:hypothetical protein